jgi:hypothetical protein
MSFQNLPQLTEEELAVVFAKCMQEDSILREPVPISKSAYRDAIVAIDNWLTANSHLADDSLPEPSKSLLSVAQKARIFFAVVNAKINAGVPVTSNLPQDPLVIDPEPEPTP